ncbi:hypothetical protein Q3G72_022578 [Acer saccharum]|nr:hypothetical protein Q3G72_022578 [Acer saccharum]
MLIALSGDNPFSKFVKVSEGSRVFKVLVVKEEASIDFAWVADMLDLKFGSDEEKDDFSLGSDLETTWGIRGGVRPSFRDEDLEDGDVMEKGDEIGGKVRSRKDVRADCKRRDKEDLSRVGSHHLSTKMDKEKQTFVKKGKRRSSNQKSLNGKLILEKGAAVMNRGFKDDSCTSSTDSSLEEGQLRNFEVFRGECSKWKSDRQEMKWAEVQRGVGQFKELSSPSRIQERSSLDSFTEGREALVRRAKCEMVKGLRQVLVNQNIRRVGADHMEGTFSLPLNGPVQLPLKDFEGGKTKGKDLVAVPITVDLDESERTSFDISKHATQKSVSSMAGENCNGTEGIVKGNIDALEDQDKENSVSD